MVSLHFLDYWRVIRLRKSLILTVFLLCLITSAALAFWLPKQYSSTVRIEVQKSAPEVDITGSQAGLQSWDPYYLTTQFRIITSWRILSTVISNLDLQHVLAKQEQAGEQEWPLDLTYAYLYNKVGVDQTRGTSLIEISVRNPRLRTGGQHRQRGGQGLYSNTARHRGWKPTAPASRA